MKSSAWVPVFRLSLPALLLATGGLAIGCSKEKLNCGNAWPSAAVRFSLLDDRTGAEWFAAPRVFSLDTLQKFNSVNSPVLVDQKVVWGFGLGNDYGLPQSGGDKTLTYYLRLSRTDTDTVEARVVYGAMTEGTCPEGFSYASTVEYRYNGRPAGAYAGSSFYCSGCSKIIAFRKQP
ncbi:hypothetical protein [Hymenobacter convexus]|uniref:hypothetical protein n=1 Tax=Hymenobacter sp. CA1UV-4 TaxID=3063782 RepID=UPI002713C2BF|nr:hypothetical protein [Hymenobacter sp. CA1UV-4]MDO7852535.1 hypothetical protein [Hymenobacter sp. CA1UV-4]